MTLRALVIKVTSDNDGGSMKPISQGAQRVLESISGNGCYIPSSDDWYVSAWYRDGRLADFEVIKSNSLNELLIAGLVVQVAAHTYELTHAGAALLSKA